jgi:hypothetical protein
VTGGKGRAKGGRRGSRWERWKRWKRWTRSEYSLGAGGVQDGGEQREIEIREKEKREEIVQRT